MSRSKKMPDRGPARILDRPAPGFFRIRQRRGGPWLQAIIYRPCPWVQPDPRYGIDGTPDPEDWCRPTERSRPLCAIVEDREATVDEVWTYGRFSSLHEHAAMAEVQGDVYHLSEIPPLF